MSNRILVRSGQGIPTTENLEELELGFDTIGKKLYIKYNNEILPIGPTKQEIVDSICKVGHILVTTNPEHPNTYLGGEWEIFGPGKTLIGIDSKNENFNTVEKTGGSTSLNLAHTHSTSGHTLTTSEIPSHSHSMSHNHTMNHTHSDTFSCSSGGSHSHSLNNSYTSYWGDDGSFRVLGWKTAAVSGSIFKLSSPSYDQRSYGSGSDFGAVSITLDLSHRHSLSGSTSSSGSHSHTISGSVSTYSGNTSSYSGSTGTAGSGNSHSHGNTESALDSYTILPPYITVYMWKRLS